MRQVLTGTVGARGMALGRARRVQSTKIRIDPTPLADNEVEGELERLHKALETAREELLALRDKLQGSMAREATEFVDAHNMLLSDPDLLRGLDSMVRDQHMRAGAALKAQRDRLAGVFDAMDDPYLRSRSEDIDQVIGLVLGEMLERNLQQALGLSGGSFWTMISQPLVLVFLAVAVLALLTALPWKRILGSKDATDHQPAAK